MNLKDYIKSIEAFLLNEDFAEGTSEDMQAKVKELEALKAEFLTFLKAIEEKGIELKTIQAKLKEGGDKSAQPAEGVESVAPPTQPADGAPPPNGEGQDAA